MTLSHIIWYQRKTGDKKCIDPCSCPCNFSWRPTEGWGTGHQHYTRVLLDSGRTFTSPQRSRVHTSSTR